MVLNSPRPPGNTEVSLTSARPAAFMTSTNIYGRYSGKLTGLTVPRSLWAPCDHPYSGPKKTPEYQNCQPYGLGEITYVPLVSPQEVTQTVYPDNKDQNQNNPREPEDDHVVHNPIMRPPGTGLSRTDRTGSRRSTGPAWLAKVVRSEMKTTITAFGEKSFSEGFPRQEASE